MTTAGEGVATGRWPQLRGHASIGLGIPISEPSAGDWKPTFASAQAAARAAADAGIEVVWMADHFSFETDDGDLRGAWDAWTMMAAVAATVPDLQIGPMVACTAYRNPGVIAKMAEAIDDISGGRFILGLGAGWNKPEYDQFGMPFEPRVSRFEEAVQIIHGLLSHGEANVQGRFYQANQARNLPRGPRPDGPPILIGSSGDRMLGILARYADAWDTGWGGNTGGLQAKVAKLEAACTAAGRDPQTVVRSVGVTFAAEGFDGDPKTALKGTVEERATFLAELVELGFRHIRIGLQPFSVSAVEALAPVVAAFYKQR